MSLKRGFTGVEDALKVASANWQKAKKVKESATEKMKECEAKIEGLVRKHRKRLLTDTKTLSLVEGVRFGFKCSKVVALPIDFDLAAFAKKYPELVSMKVSATAVKGLMKSPTEAKKMEKLGISVKEMESFGVKKG